MGAAKTKAEPAVGHRAVGGAALCELPSEELAWHAGRGCQASFAELVRRYAPRLQAFLQRKIRDRHEAEDLVQDTLLKAYRSLDRYDESWRFSTWLFTIASRAAVSHHRRRQPAGRGDGTPNARIRAWEPDAGVARTLEAPACSQTIERQERRENLWTAAARLPEGQYRSLWLRYAEDMSIKDIARVMGKSQVCVKVLLYRARTALAQRLQETDL